VKILRGILAITLIAMLLIGNLIESAAHAGTSDCVGAHCHDHVQSHDTSEAGHSHEGTNSDHVAHDCCNQIFCQAVALSEYPTMVHPLGLQSASWAQGGQLAAVNWPRTLERPPNS
jgi:hypothetical protein